MKYFNWREIAWTIEDNNHQMLILNMEERIVKLSNWQLHATSKNMIWKAYYFEWEKYYVCKNKQDFKYQLFEKKFFKYEPDKLITTFVKDFNWIFDEHTWFYKCTTWERRKKDK